MKGLIDVQCFGGPYDGLRLHITSSPSFVFEVRGKGGIVEKRDVYALEVAQEGYFRLRHLTTQEELA